jgi:hypothetical protein
MPYTHFRVIGYRVPTASSAGSVISGWGAGAEPAGIATIPVPPTLPDDPRIRLKRLAAIVNMAHARRPVNETDWPDDPNMLKVFVVPEFYFRPPSTLGVDYVGNTYPRDVGMQVLGALDQMFANPIFANWLFVCGTVLFNTRDDTMAPPLYHNSAVVVKGGQPQGMRLVEKRVPSGIDGVPQVMVGGRAQGRGPGNDAKMGPYLQNWKQRKDHVMEFGGAIVGVEVCLDHADSDDHRVLKHVVRDWSNHEDPRAGSPDLFASADVQLHILTCGGMRLKPNSVAAKVNGYVVRNDGMVNPGDTVEMHQVTAYQKNGATNDEFGDPFPAGARNAGANLTRVPPSATVPVPRMVQGALVPPPPAPYPTMAQSLVYYAPRALP